MASLLVRDLPRGDLLVETKFSFDLPPDVQANFEQAGFALYKNDDAFVKLAHVAIFETRQTEWAKEVPTLMTPPGRRYGNTVIGPPARPEGTPATTWLRIVRRGDRYTGYSSIDGRRWVRGATWTHDLPGARLALFAMGGPGGHVAEFDYVRIYRPARRQTGACGGGLGRQGRVPRGDVSRAGVRDRRRPNRAAARRSAPSHVSVYERLTDPAAA